MRPKSLLAISIASLALAACASSVLPDYGDSGRRNEAAVDAVDRVDVRPSCADFQTVCSNRCVDTQEDPANCGACGRACVNGSACRNGTCGGVCMMPQTSCNGRCVDPFTDLQNCGGCNRACPIPVGGAAMCTMGVCGVQCSPERTQCGSQCVDASNDSMNCGGCGRVCSAGTRCAGSMCRMVMGVTRYDITRGMTSFTEVCSSPGAVHMLMGVDDVVGTPVPIPFTFPFFGVPYDAVRPSSNGYIVFGTTPEPHDNAYFPDGPLPSANRPHAAAFAYNSDLWHRS